MIFPDFKIDRVLLLGVGNYLMGDEGVGVHVAQRLAEHDFPPGVEVLDGGTAGFHLMGIIEQYDVVVLIDATLEGGQPAGTIRLIEPRFAADFPRSMSTHDVGLRDVVEALELTGRLPKTYLVAVAVEEIQPMVVRLSPAVQDSAVQIVKELHTLLWDWWREGHLASASQTDNPYSNT